MRTKEYLAAVRAREGALLADDDALPRRGAARQGDVPTGGKKPAKKQLDEAVALIEELSTDWDPDALRGLLPRAAARA